MGRLVDLTGQRFGRLVVKKRGKTKRRNNGGTIVYWLCQCDCGNVVEVVGGDLKRGCTQSCGCLSRETAKTRLTKHGMSGTRLYEIWQNMKDRCYNEKDCAFKYYGKNGVKICGEWQEFESFYKWALANGYTDDLTIDRVDVNGDYEPNNCRWATRKEQANNKTTNRYITFNGDTKTLKQWSEVFNVSYPAFSARLKRGWSMEKIKNTPVRVVNREY
jgi:hypothetical protein